MMEFQVWTCSNGSDSFTLAAHDRFDFAIFEFGGQYEVATWEITEGTPTFSDLAGSGTKTLDFDGATVVYTGQVEG